VDFIGDGNARGNQRQKTFLTEHDCQAFLERTAKYHKQYGGFSPLTA
jgi:hypothetical protein